MLITQGFIARHGDGGTAILGRGGSDTSAAYFGALLKAQRVEIWTDVPGMFSANPRDVPEARLLTRLDYAEAQEIATTGAKVLHPRSIAPCRDAGVPMAILDTERPDLPGTRIDATAATVPGVKAISRRNGIVLVSMESIGMWQQVGFLADVFERFKRHGLSIDLIGSSETNVTVSLDPSENLVTTNVLEALSADLAEVCRVKVIAPCAAITLVGRGMRSLLHRLSDIWATFGRERVHLISQSSNDLNLTFVIDEADADGLLPHLHAELIRSRRDAGARRQRVRPELARDRARQAATRAGVVARAPRAVAGDGRRGHAALRLRPGDGARARPLADVHRRGRPLLLRDQGQPAPGDPQAPSPAKASAWNACRRASSSTCSPRCPSFAPERVLFTPSFAPRARVRGRVRTRHHRHPRQHRGAAALAGGVPRPHDLAAHRPGPRRGPSREGPHRRRRRQVRPADDALRRLPRGGAQARRAHQRPARAPGQRHRGSAALARCVRAPGRAGRQRRHDRDHRHRRRPADPVHARVAGVRPRAVARRPGGDQVGVPALRPGDRARPLPGRRERRAAAGGAPRWSRRTACGASAATPA